MKRLFSLVMCFAILISATACGNSEKENSSNDTTGPTQSDAANNGSENSGSIDVDEGLLNVEITLPAYMFEEEDMSDFDADAYAKEQGFSKAVLNDDGSITVTMSKRKHKELLKELAEQYDQNFADLVEAEDTPYIKKITHSDDFGEIIMEVDRAAYENAFDLTPFLLGLTGMMYQAFLEGDTHVEIIVKDADTGDTISSTVYPDALNS